MNRSIQRSLLAAIFALPWVAFGQSAELLVPVTGQEEQRVLAANHYFVEKYRYLAKRLRIVKIDTNLLLGEQERLTISPFKDVSIPVRRMNVLVRNGGLGFTWDGQYASVPMTRDDFVAYEAALGMSPNGSEHMYELLFGIRIIGAKYIFDPRTGNSHSLSGMRRDPVSGRFIYESDRLAQIPDATEFYGVRFDLRPPPQAQKSDQSTAALFSTAYAVRSLAMDRRYHVVYEVDPDKRIPTGHVNLDTNPEAAEKIRRYREFVESLGDDPRKAASREGNQQ